MCVALQKFLSTDTPILLRRRDLCDTLPFSQESCFQLCVGAPCNQRKPGSHARCLIAAFWGSSRRSTSSAWWPGSSCTKPRRTSSPSCGASYSAAVTPEVSCAVTPEAPGAVTPEVMCAVTPEVSCAVTPEVSCAVSLRMSVGVAAAPVPTDLCRGAIRDVSSVKAASDSKIECSAKSSCVALSLGERGPAHTDLFHTAGSLKAFDSLSQSPPTAQLPHPFT